MYVCVSRTFLDDYKRSFQKFFSYIYIVSGCREKQTAVEIAWKNDESNRDEAVSESVWVALAGPMSVQLVLRLIWGRQEGGVGVKNE